jgi:hypothetical protein
MEGKINTIDDLARLMYCGTIEIMHLAMHRGQIRTVRNLYRTARGELGLFLPHNPLFTE